MRNFYLMIGLPYSGKSYWINDVFGSVLNCDVKVLSFDDCVNEIAIQNNMKYSEVFLKRDLMKEADGLFKEKKVALFEHDTCDVIMDTTNLTCKGRMKQITYARQCGFERINYVFFKKPENTKEANVWFKRMEERKDKVVHENVLQRMYAYFDYPDLSKETPDRIEIVSNPWK